MADGFYGNFPSQMGPSSTDRRVNAQVALTVTVASLPTSNPHVAGQLWNNGGTVATSSG